jgi:hypothetical protein
MDLGTLGLLVLPTLALLTYRFIDFPEEPHDQGDLQGADAAPAGVGPLVSVLALDDPGSTLIFVFSKQAG